jgi:predicted secreted protein
MAGIDFTHCSRCCNRKMVKIIVEEKVPMEFTDKRGKGIIYLNHCLLNQNTRAPGAAFRKAASNELIHILLKNELNIEQLPCLECIGTGGIQRKSLDRFLPLISISIDQGWFTLIRPLIRMRLYQYRRLCKKMALKSVDAINQFLNAGCTVTGIIGMNDSPTCGVTKSLDFTELVKRMAIERNSAISLKKIIQDALIDAPSYFMGSIIDELKKRGMDIQVIGFEPWRDSQENEARRIATELKLIV